jgi:hypothetical protein
MYKEPEEIEYWIMLCRNIDLFSSGGFSFIKFKNAEPTNLFLAYMYLKSKLFSIHNLIWNLILGSVYTAKVKLDFCKQRNLD